MTEFLALLWEAALLLWGGLLHGIGWALSGGTVAAGLLTAVLVLTAAIVGAQLSSGFGLAEPLSEDPANVVRTSRD